MGFVYVGTFLRLLVDPCGQYDPAFDGLGRPGTTAATCEEIGCRGLGEGFRIQGVGFRVQGSGFRVQGLRFQAWGTITWGMITFTF